MCFAPKISLATFILEFVVATYLWVRGKSSFVVRFLVIFIYVLGFYQFTEFMLCTTGDIALWGTLGFLTYNLLPALGLHFTLKCRRKKFPYLLLYIPTIVFGAVAIFTKGFISEGSCLTFFVLVKTLYYRSEGSLFTTLIYWSYYFGYILLSSIYLYFGIVREKDRGRRLLYVVALAALLISIVPAFVLMIIFPSLGMVFPSMYCEFALLFSIAALFGVYISDKYGIQV